MKNEKIKSKKRKCRFCGADISNRNKKFDWCATIHEKERAIERAREWDLDNPEKRRKIAKKASKKFMTEKRKRFNKMMNESYYRNKEKVLARKKAYTMLKVNKKINHYKLARKCGVCDKRYKVRLFYDIYPLTSENIIKALNEKKIRYLCSKHWREAATQRKLKYLRDQYKIKRAKKMECSNIYCINLEDKIHEVFTVKGKRYCRACFMQMARMMRVPLRKIQR